MAISRPFLIALAALFAFAPAGVAAERAEISLIGFSADIRYFAFEEFGIQDGSGFAYSSIFIVDLVADSWPAGPFRIRADTEETTLTAIRSDALEQASGALVNYAITEPPVMIALNGDGETGLDGLTLDFGIPGYSQPGHVFGDYSLSLEIFKSTSPQDCIAYLGDNPMGFALLIASEGGVRDVHRDASIPNSRGCPTTYRIYGVAAPFWANDLSAAVALVSVYAFGFEGVDRRFIALPLGADF
jgi:predicted secreted protein